MGKTRYIGREEPPDGVDLGLRNTLDGIADSKYPNDAPRAQDVQPR